MDFKETIKDFINYNVNEIQVISSSEEFTINFAKEFASYLKSGDILSLDGELGSGKTVFMKGIASFFNIQNDVSSPTFTIVNEYSTEFFPIFHFDVYRLKNSNEFENTIGTDYFYNGLCIIEWGKIITDILPENTIFIDIQKTNENERKLIIRRKNK